MDSHRDKVWTYLIDADALTVPTVGAFDAPLRTYQINEQWAGIVAGLVRILADGTRWQANDQERLRATRAINRFLLGVNPVANLSISQDGCDIVLSDGATELSRFTLDDSACNLLSPQRVTIVNNQIQIDNDGDGVPDNIYEQPPQEPNTYPDATVGNYTADELCNAAYYLADKTIEFAEATIDDASTITLAEFLVASLGLGGFDGSLLKAFWDYAIANLSGLSGSDLTIYRDDLAGLLYCENLDRDAPDYSSIPQPAQGALVGALNAVTTGKWSLWAFVGSTIDAGKDCTTFNCEQCVLLDFTVSSYGFFLDEDVSLFAGIQQIGQHTASGWSSTYTSYGDVDLRGVAIKATINSTNITRLEMDFDIDPGINAQLGIDDGNKRTVANVASGNNQTLSHAVNAVESTLYAALIVNNTTNNANSDPGGTGRIKAIRIYYTGTAPNIGVECT